MTNDTSFDAATYDDRQGFVAEYGRDLLGTLDPQPGERILDVGCGTGTVTADIAAAVGEDGSVLGIDASPSMVDRASSQFPDLDVQQADVTAFTASAPFDAVFSNAALHWIDDQDAAISSVADALRPGGRFVAELGAAGNVSGIVDAVAAEGETRGVDVSNPWHFPTLGTYASRLEAHGFEVELARTFGRETHLDGDDGLRSWFSQFGDGLLAPFDPDERDDVLAAVEDRLRADRYDPAAERWIANYRRLQFRAVRRET